MSKLPYFSIVIPAYNVEKYFDKCLESVCNQTFKDFEAIIVDDGSDDGTAEICDAYAGRDDRLIVVHKENGGCISARRAGVQLSKGKYIINLDGDDYLEPDLLESVYKVLNKKEYDIVWYSFNRVNDAGDLLESKALFDGEKCGRDVYENMLCDESRPFFTVTYDYSLWTKAIKREIIYEKMMLAFNDIIMGEDLIVTLPTVMSADNIFFLNKQLYNYRYNYSSLSYVFRVDDIKNLKMLLKNIESICDTDNDKMQRQLGLYSLMRVLNVLVLGIKTLHSYNQLKNLTNDIDDYIINKLSYAKFTGIKQFIYYFIIRFRLYRVFWIYYKNK